MLKIALRLNSIGPFWALLNLPSNLFGKKATVFSWVVFDCGFVNAVREGDRAGKLAVWRFRISLITEFGKKTPTGSLACSH